jgi:hypothetical protein
MIDVVVDTSSLRRSGMGSITGVVFLQGPAGAFPDDRWSDFPVVILSWWIEGLTAVAAGREMLFQGMFMDGPLAFVVQRGTGTSGRIESGKRSEEIAVGIVDVAALLRSTVAAGRLVAKACRAQAWSSPDLETLGQAITGSAV